MWDFLPVNSAEIKQIEAVRGPGSAVWGANAMTGVVNLITKRPKEMVGTSLLLGGGELGTAYGSIAHAGVSGKLRLQDLRRLLRAGSVRAADRRHPGREPPQHLPDSRTRAPSSPRATCASTWDSTDASVFSAAPAMPAPTASSTRASDRSTSRRARTSPTARSTGPTRRPSASASSPTSSTPTRSNLLTVGTDGQPLGLHVRDRHLQSRPLEHHGRRRAQHPHLRRATTATASSTSRSRRKATDKTGVGRLPAGRDPARRQGALGDRRPLRRHRPDRRRLHAADEPAVRADTHHTFRVSYNEAFRTPSAINNYLDATILDGSPPLPAAGRPPTATSIWSRST